MASSSRIVDAHQHVFWHGRDDRGLVVDMDECGIEYAWLLAWEIAPWEAWDAKAQTLPDESDRRDNGPEVRQMNVPMEGQP